MKEVLKKNDERMQRRIDHLTDEFKSIRAGRANPAVLDKITVDYYGVPTPINQLSSIQVTEARTLVIQPYDASSLKSIEKAIQMSDVGINPQNDGKVLRLIFPPLTEDKRKEIAKDIARIAEDSKVQIRNVRRDTIEKLKKMKKSGELTEDDLEEGEKKVQKSTDKFIKQIDELTEKKKKEIMEI
ncbi:MAG: ribosome recycling factor [Ruminococcus sp.]|uniref:ribosome recycling factor n=1 Tax=Ruminococcus sp. TaxID=41978 RepID=UPI0028732740|nr:ribosome recycling factor [Ruminococcus sp.]MBQ3284047.1 ribosome recycling factor [Ruminococcus sp.]